MKNLIESKGMVSIGDTRADFSRRPKNPMKTPT